MVDTGQEVGPGETQEELGPGETQEELGPGETLPDQSYAFLHCDLHVGSVPWRRLCYSSPVF